MVSISNEYMIRDDIAFLLEAEKISKLDFANATGVSRTTLNEIDKTGRAREDVCEKIYAYAYGRRYRINSVKEELIREKYQNVLFHGSKRGLSEISVTGARDNCDFGQGFYLGETYRQALSFVYEAPKSSVYSFSFDFQGLDVKRFDCTLDWMLAICCYRGTLGAFSNGEYIERLVSDVENADVVIAPIADNRMFYIMAQFAQGEINADAAIHSLSASSLGYQYIIKSERALGRLNPIEKYYLCSSEREDCRKISIERSYEIDTKLKLSRREFTSGKYIEEILT